MVNNTTQWKKRIELFRYIYSCLIKGENKASNIKKDAFENYVFSDEQTKLIEYFANNQPKIVEIISKNLAETWTWERIPTVEKAILISTYVEFQVNKIDKKILIDQALVTTKHYAEPKSTKYINAILDKILI